MEKLGKSTFMDSEVTIILLPLRLFPLAQRSARVPHNLRAPDVELMATWHTNGLERSALVRVELFRRPS